MPPRPSVTSYAGASSLRVLTSPGSPGGLSSFGPASKSFSGRVRGMGAKVRVDSRSGRLYLDLHVKGRRKRVFSDLPATPRNVEILTAKAETIEREVFLGTLDLERHFAKVLTRPVSVREVYE